MAAKLLKLRQALRRLPVIGGPLLGLGRFVYVGGRILGTAQPGASVENGPRLPIAA